MSDKFYVTTPIYYVNDKPHIGHAFTSIIADVLARYNKSHGKEVFFLTGTDEHGAKIAKAAAKNNKQPQAFADHISEEFRKLSTILNLSNNEFIRTTDQEKHWPGVFKIWQAIEEKGDFYKGSYEGLYCLGHEAFIKKSELKDGVCPDHLTEPETINEENIFFKLTRYKDQIKKLYVDGTIKIKPESRTNEVLNMLEDSGDVSFSRPKKDLEWGIPVPGDDSQTIYVWADALTNYLSAIGYGRGEDPSTGSGQAWRKWWPADVQVMAKDILRFHAIIWPAMLLSAGLELPKELFVHGFITADGQKMSKTIGNVIDPVKLVDKYGTDAVRYFLLREISSGEDGDFSVKKLEDRYNGDLANNLGNLVSRFSKLVETRVDGALNRESQYLNDSVSAKIEATQAKVEQCINDFRLHEALSEIFVLFSFANEYINGRAPWAQVEPAHINETMINLGELLICGNQLLRPFLPDTSEKIADLLGQPGVANTWGKIKIMESKPLFPRLN